MLRILVYSLVCVLPACRQNVAEVAWPSVYKIKVIRVVVVVVVVVVVNWTQMAEDRVQW
jgi:hypothetical protein